MWTGDKITVETFSVLINFVILQKIFTTMKKIKFLFTVIAMLAGIFVYVSCQNSEIEPIEEPESALELKGVQEFRTALINLSNGVNSRSFDEEPSQKDIETLVEVSRDFLAQNDITKEDLDIEDDEMLAVVAMALLDYQKTVVDQPVSRTTAGGCVLEALGVREVVNAAGKGAVKKVAKVAAKAVLKKAIPYLGWGLFIYDYVACVVE